MARTEKSDVTFTCNHCKTTREVSKSEHYPKGWKSFIVNDPAAARDHSIDLCGEDASTFLEFIAPSESSAPSNDGKKPGKGKSQ